MPCPYIWVTPEGENEVKTLRLVNCLVAEFLGTMFLVLIGCGSCMMHGADSDYVRIALAFGVTVATMAQAIGHISGCHINPAITAGLFVGAKIGLVKSLLYIAVQIIGALVGAALLKAFTPLTMKGAQGLGGTGLSNGVTAGQGFGIEFFITFVLVLVVFAAAADGGNQPNVKGSAPLAIGLSITTCHLFAIPFTGSSMNPARSLGPAVLSTLHSPPQADLAFENHWIYWLGPILGGICAALVYVILFEAEKPQTYSTVATSDNKPV